MRLARARLSEVQLALMMLTRLPAGQISVLPAMGAAAWAFPLVGGLVGLQIGSFINLLVWRLPQMMQHQWQQVQQ